MSTVLAASLILFASGAAAVLLALLSDRFVPLSLRRDLGRYGGMVSVIALGLFTLTVATVVTFAWLDLAAGQRSSSREATALTEVYWYAHSVGGKEGLELQVLLRDYTTQVINAEWPFMASSGELTDRGWNLADRIRLDLEKIEPKPDGPTVRYSAALQSVSDLFIGRREREALVDSRAPALLWVAVVLSALVVVLLPVVRGNPRPATRAVLAFVAAASVAFVIFLLYQLNGPFSGAIKVDPTAFRWAAQGYDDIDAQWKP
ncbi:DUF4239 domain-containing protein [Actinomadura barringtoniae]|uniref:DUF4239 domain-containing protein n=1 Tax=Actinomadura barringtoniae TaxID=1427535 RepID=A0A939T4H6_9ACTN|nr:DUF4239 domain-containing protein [Actinomadura barringtoniae]MBO2448224.1 DUF4239 domain-containing protein [Actinomadura barringtoniae]